MPLPVPPAPDATDSPTPPRYHSLHLSAGVFDSPFWVTLVSVEIVLRNFLTRMCGIISGETDAMHLPRFLSVKREEEVFTEARALALLRLEQCIADLRIAVPTIKLGIEPLGPPDASHPQEPPLSLLKWPDRQCVPTPVLNSDPPVTATEKIINSLRVSSGKLMRVTFSDGVVQTVIIGTTDDEGFLHRDADGADPQIFWTRFEDVNALEAEIAGSNYLGERHA